MNLRNSENVWVLAGFLGVTGILAALILSVVSRLTAEPVRQARLKGELQMLKALSLPEFDNDMTAESFHINGVKYMAARKDGKIVGFAAESSSKSGYSGLLRALTGFDAQGNVLAVQIIEHKETPGLGAAVCERKFQKTIFNLFDAEPAGLPPNAILDQFKNKNRKTAGNWKISKDGGEFAYRTGATVTSRAVTAMVDSAAANLGEAMKYFSGGNAK